MDPVVNNFFETDDVSGSFMTRILVDECKLLEYG